MAGKSTVLRSTVAVALLAACGFYAPVAAAAVPYTDAFMLRTFSADAPLEGRSSFAVEMVEMRCAWRPGPSALPGHRVFASARPKKQVVCHDLLEGRSSFAVEMVKMRCAWRPITAICMAAGCSC